MQQPPAQQMNPDQLPQDVVVITAWTGEDPNPVQMTVTKKSWDDFSKVMSDNFGLYPEETYEFDGKTSPGGRKTKVFISNVSKITGNYYTGVIPIKGADA